MKRNPKDLSKFDQLTKEILGIGKRTINNFEKFAKANITDSKLLEIIDDVIYYWKDNFRPALTFFSCEAVGGQPKKTDILSLMITLLSVGGGIHDDILDKSYHKHFRKTIFGLHGIDNSLLVGDLFILKGWKISKELIWQISNPKKLFEILNVFGNWTTQVCIAEFMEISCKGNLQTSLHKYKTILRKSMVDLEACARLGGIVGDGVKYEIEALAKFGSRLGYMYRLLDEVKDTQNIEGNLNERLRNESIPLPILFSSKTKSVRYSQINSILKKAVLKPTDISLLIEICFDSKAFEYIFKLAKTNKAIAQELLSRLRVSSIKKVLKARENLELLLEKPYIKLQNLCH